MSKPALKCVNNSFSGSTILKLLIDLKIAYTCYFGQRENLNFPDKTGGYTGFFQKRYFQSSPKSCQHI